MPQEDFTGRTHFDTTSASFSELRSCGINPNSYNAEAMLHVDRETERLRRQNTSSYSYYSASKPSKLRSSVVKCLNTIVGTALLIIIVFF